MDHISIAMRTFNEKVRTMNQTNGKNLVLTVEHARSLHSDIFSLLTNIAELTANVAAPPAPNTTMDGGKF